MASTPVRYAAGHTVDSFIGFASSRSVHSRPRQLARTTRTCSPKSLYAIENFAGISFVRLDLSRKRFATLQQALRERLPRAE